MYRTTSTLGDKLSTSRDTCTCSVVKIQNSEVNNVWNVNHNPKGNYKIECRASRTFDKCEGRIRCHGFHTVPTERNLTESEPSAFAMGSLGRTQSKRRANPDLTQSERLKRTQIFTSGPSKRSWVRYCVIDLSINVVVNWLDNGVMEL
jgi:hypothetical protein